MRTIVAPLILILPVVCHAAERDEFDAYKQQFKTHQQSEKAAYRAYTEQMEREWKAYLADIKKNFGSIDYTSDKKWVSYSSDRKSKVAVDNDKGVVTVEFVSDEQGKAGGIREAKALIRELSKEVNPFSSVPVLTENLPLDKIRPEDAKPRGPGGKEGEKVYSVSVRMNEDRQENNEVQIAESVRDMTEKFKVPYDLAMAIIKAESNFNVGARARQGALDIRNPRLYENNSWGLMQVIPGRGGREGLKRAKGRDRVPSADELLDPKTNLEIGVAYLAVLQNDYFAGVKDEKVRELVTTAAYRDGPEKIFALFNARGKKAEAVAEINRQDPEAVARRLTTKVAGPKAPDSAYVAKVEKERDNYRVNEQEKKELERVAGTIAKTPELRAAINSWIGVPYRWGGTTREAVDCSAFTMNVYASVFNMKLPRTADGQYFRYGRSAVDDRSRREGDLVYFDTLHNGKPVSHVGIWLDNNRFVHASSKKGVIIADITNVYYRSRYVGANRPGGE